MGHLIIGDPRQIERGACNLRRGFQQVHQFVPLQHAGAMDERVIAEHDKLASISLNNGWFSSEFNDVGGMAKLACSDCMACYQSRVDLLAYNPGKTVTKLAEQNSDILSTLIYSNAEIILHEHYDLYERYIKARQAQVPDAKFEQLSIDIFTEKDTRPDLFIELRDNDDSRTLRGVLCANEFMYTDDTAQRQKHYICNLHYYDPDLAPERKLGLHTINQAFLALQNHATNMFYGKAYGYMGSWMATKGMYSYKGFFRPELFIDNKWQSWEAANGLARERVLPAPQPMASL